jgi:hypothetical protein
MKQAHQAVSQPPCWIGPANWQDQVKPDVQHPYALRKGVILNGPCIAATLNITAAWRYNLWINGTFISQGPARCFPEHMLYDTLDISVHLHVGENVIAVLLIPSHGVPGYTPVTRSGLWVDGRITSDNTTVPLVTDTSWQIRKADWINFHHLFISLPVGQQEHYNAQLEPKDWRSCVDANDSRWQSPLLLGTHPAPPWWHLSPRPHRLLVESPIPAQLVWRGNMPEKWPQLPTNPAIAFNAMALVGQACDGTISKTITLNPGEVVTLDFGQTQLIRPALSLLQAVPEARLLMCYDITLANRPTAMRGFGTAQEGFCDSITLGNQTMHWQAMLPRGFRFMTICCDACDAVTVSQACHVVRYPFDEPKTPVFKDKSLKAIWETSVRTLHASCSDAIVDTCSREQMLWTLDACLAGEAAYVTFGETALWRRCLKLIAQGIDAHGCPRAVVPAATSFMVLFDQTMYWLVSCQRYVQRTGDRSLIDGMAAPAERFLKLCASHVTFEDLFVPPNYSWHFVDWVHIPRQAYSMPINAMLVWACDAACDLFASDVARALSARLREALPRFFDEVCGCYRNHLEPTCDVGVQNPFNHTQDNATHGLHANALALRIALPDAAQQQRVIGCMLNMLKNPDDFGSRMGPGWAEIILGALLERDHAAAVVDYLKGTFGKLTEANVPTWPEGFSTGEQTLSPFNTAHAWGSVVNVLLATLATR